MSTRTCVDCKFMSNDDPDASPMCNRVVAIRAFNIVDGETVRYKHLNHNCNYERAAQNVENDVNTCRPEGRFWEQRTGEVVF